MGRKTVEDGLFLIGPVRRQIPNSELLQSLNKTYGSTEVFYQTMGVEKGVNSLQESA